MNTLGLVNVLNNDGNVLIDVAQMADNHIQNAAIHNALAEWNETDDPFSPETTQRLIGKLKGEMPSLIAWLSEGNYPKSGLVPELLAYVKMPHPLQVYKNLDLDITIEDSEKGPAFDVKLSYAGNAEHFKYAHLPVETDKTSVVLSIIDAHDDLQLKNDPEHHGYREAVEKNYSKLTDLIGKDGIDSIRDFHEGVETGKYFSDMEFDLKDPDPSAKHILECLGSLEKPVQKAMDNFARVTTFRNLAEKNLLREATLFTSGMLEEKNGRLIVPQGYRRGETPPSPWIRRSRLSSLESWKQSPHPRSRSRSSWISSSSTQVTICLKNRIPETRWTGRLSMKATSRYRSVQNSRQSWLQI